MPVFLSVETAVPLGLIINELVSNAYKHAFPDGRSGQITIQLMEADDQQLRLTIRDNGIGLSSGNTVLENQSLGLTIVNTLVDQIRGTIDWEGQNGVACHIYFPLQDSAATQPTVITSGRP